MRKLLSALMMLGLVTVTPSAHAGEQPPNAFFKAAGAEQKGWVGSYCWDGVCVDKIPTVPEKAEKVEAGIKARIRIKHPVKPSGFSLEAYRELDEYGRPSGDPESIPTKLRAHERRGKVVAWDARFTLPKESGRVYLFAAAAWPHGPNKPEGDVFWTFHLKLT